MTKSGFFFALLIMLVSCEGIDDPMKTDKGLKDELYSKAKSIITIGSHEYSLEAYLWRDFMPISPPDGRPLIALNWIVSNDSTPVPASIGMVNQYVINNDYVWVAEYESTNGSIPDYKMEKISRNGPKWGPGIKVDVISRIRDLNTGTDYYLILTDVYINRTE